MGIFDRIVLAFCALCTAVISLGVVLLATRLISLEDFWTTLSRIYGHWDTGLAGGILLLASIRLLFAGIISKRRHDTLVLQSETGGVFVSIAAVESLVEKTARHSRGVRNVKVRISSLERGLVARLKIAVSPDANVPSLASQIQEKIQDTVRDTVGISLAEVTVLVENISNEFKPKHRVE